MVIKSLLLFYRFLRWQLIKFLFSITHQSFKMRFALFFRYLLFQWKIFCTTILTFQQVVGTGPRGRITVEDVEAHKQPAAVSAPATPQPVAAAPPVIATPTPPPPPPATASFTDLQLSNMRKTIAKRLTESKQTVPHYYLSVDINMDNVLE